ncbi:OadG family protein [Niameybacter massiliensis]|uniref:OadG family protein n=1 Tax=Holtiella tumoricola TaxID=3018743 RepID=A0AA42J1F6_9FIRM|nr:OadG family protein [Holtiella tumoricola]MDA3732497.1 OadG family protein [Holtiella tumoricola]
MEFSLNFGAMVDGLSVFLIGVSMVFVVLLILIALIKVTGMIVATIESKKDTNKEVAVTVVQEEVLVVEAVDETSELELVAVITAAIAASLGTTADQLQVRSLRQINRHRA